MEKTHLEMIEECVLDSLRVVMAMRKERDQKDEVLKKLSIDVAAKDHRAAIQTLKNAGYLKE